MIQNLLLEDPWPVALALIIVAAVLVFLGIQRSNKRFMRFAGFVAAGAVVLFLVASLITTTRERLIADTHRLVGYTSPLQIEAFKSLVDPRVTVTVEEAGGAHTIAGQTVFESLVKTVTAYPLEDQTIKSINAQVRGENSAVCSFDVRTYVRNVPAMTRWVLTWEKQADGVWRVTGVQWLDCPGVLGVKPTRHWLK